MRMYPLFLGWNTKITWDHKHWLKVNFLLKIFWRKTVSIPSNFSVGNFWYCYSSSFFHWACRNQIYQCSDTSMKHFYLSYFGINLYPPQVPRCLVEAEVWMTRASVLFCSRHPDWRMFLAVYNGFSAGWIHVMHHTNHTIDVRRVMELE